ncbi:conserved hypothetical protein [Afipia carboxidovorans OM5]|uniref:Transmembrane protein n=1 Tax=Afipia carboxidovorans (strain ATCC 49405 / DSM 1227 / KCTC 32145 / OM5) TaxID=504832 RepID=B6JIZ0_AFIC5|nr:DUF2852 domain-containing protein [Afipia carboxidovorans]ACI94399.1 conserved hypothetical protein [Afipia carboxidovorans OM5]AEI01967.1 hypothetical protein OCA4_c08200 [Afipia carboxidovorans OM4]AEI05543.1 hypothetical protein OCA5_c08210 [Afipia carboxidovorans OM5]
MANTADFDRSGRPAFAGSRHDDFAWRHEGWRPGCHPASILVIIAAFIIWWPLGLAALAYTFWSRKMGCWNYHGRFADKMERMQWKMDRMRSRMDGRGFWGPSSGNRAFDEYRMETLRRLEEEQKEFKEFLERLRHAKDKEEFDAFMAQHRPRPAGDQPQS